MIKGGEIAYSHRHTQAALRVVIEGEGAYTAVNGERFPMQRGDLILTPSWSWHDHEKVSDGPMIWLDGLDVPLMRQLSLSFFEELHDRQVARSRPDGFSLASFGRGMTPVDGRFGSHVPVNIAAPQLRFPYQDARGALALMANSAPPDPNTGYMLRYTNSATGGHILPTISAFLRLLPQGFASRRSRRTDAEILLVLEGSGESRIGDRTFAWRENDILVVPNWTWYSHVSRNDAVLFSFSDRALHEAIGVWREQTEDC
jgi:gentisate 1,2-dioxygenase